MRVPLSWLHELCDPGLEPRQLAERLSMTGTEVERITHVGVASVDGFVVGRVLSADPHPDADRLRVCSVDAGEGEPRTIVCGAPNVATPHPVFPNDVEGRQGMCVTRTAAETAGRSRQTRGCRRRRTSS